MEHLPEGSVFTTHEIARFFGVNPGTVVRWIHDKRLIAFRTMGGHFRILRDDLVLFLRECEKAAPLKSGKTLSILVIDDDSTVFELLQKDFRTNFGDQVTLDCARDGFEGGRKVTTAPPDIVFLDLMMPGLNGFDVCRKIKNDGAAVKTEIVALTGFYTEENAAKIIEAGAELCIAKPLDLALIRGYVRSRLTEILEPPVIKT